EEESRSFARSGFRPNAAAVGFDNTFADGKSDTRAGYRAVVQALEDTENALAFVRLKAAAVVADGEPPMATLALGGDMNSGRLFLTAILDRVADQILENTHDLGGMRVNFGQRIVGHGRAALANSRRQISKSGLQRIFAIGRSPGQFALSRQARISQQILNQALHLPGALRGIFQEFLTLLPKPVPVALPEKLRIAHYGPQRLLKIMACDVSELLQVGIRSCQCFHMPRQRLFGGFSILNIGGSAGPVERFAALVQDRHSARLEP